MQENRVVVQEDGHQAVPLLLPFDPALRLDDMLPSLITDIGVSVTSNQLEVEAETKHALLMAMPSTHRSRTTVTSISGRDAPFLEFTALSVSTRSAPPTQTNLGLW